MKRLFEKSGGKRPQTLLAKDRVEQVEARLPRPSVHLALLVGLLVLGAIAPQFNAMLGVEPSEDGASFVAPLSVLIAAIVAVAGFGIAYVRLQSRYERTEKARAQDNHASLHDPMTGAANRRHFESALDELADDKQGAHSLLMIDLDRFKPVNDLYGHAAGDELLREVANGLAKLVRTEDMVARLGGDEFAVLLRDRSGSEAEAVAVEVLEYVSHYRLNWEGHRVGVGASIGMVTIHKQEATSNELLETADAALYAAKEAGRGAAFVGTCAKGKPYDTDLRRVDAGNPKPVSSASSHEPHDGRKPELFGQKMYKLQSREPDQYSQRQGSRRQTAVSTRIVVEARTLGDDSSPGMSMRELMDHAATRGDGGADFVRWMFRVTIDSTFHLSQARLNSTGFVVSIPARAVVAVPELAGELVSLNAMAPKPLRNLTFVLHGVGPVASDPLLQAFQERMQGSGIDVAIELRANTLDVLAPLRHVDYQHIYVSRELTHGIKPGNAAYGAMTALEVLAGHMSTSVVASDLDSIKSLIHLENIGIDWAYGSGIKPAELLVNLLKD